MNFIGHQIKQNSLKHKMSSATTMTNATNIFEIADIVYEKPIELANIFNQIDELYEEAGDLPLKYKKMISMLFQLKQQKDEIIDTTKNRLPRPQCEDAVKLKKKRNTNEDDKRYLCDKCGCRFMRKSGLVRHLKTKKCNHIYVERIFTNATERVSDCSIENDIKNKNNILKNYDRLFIKKIVNMVQNNTQQFMIYCGSKQNRRDRFNWKLSKIYMKKYSEYIENYKK
jgi:hypothetical protein